MDSTAYRALPLNDDYEAPKRTNCCCRKVCCNKVTVWHIIVTSLVLLVSFVLVAYFVLVPAYIQKLVNRTDLTFVSVMMRNITNTTVTISAQGVISAAGPISASIVPVASFSISYQNISMGYMDLPQIQSKGGQPTKLEITDKTISISNSTHFVIFSSDLLNNVKTTWDIEGHVDVSIWIFPFHKIKFKKSVPITGMNGLEGTTVESFTLPGDGPGHLKVSINVFIENPSFVCMQIGDIYFDVIFENATIGSVLAKNVTLMNGTNYYSMSGMIQPTNEAGLQAVNDFVNLYISGQPSAVSVKGVGGSASAPAWLNTVLQSLKMTTQINGVNDTLISNLALSQSFMGIPGEAGASTDSGVVVMASFINAEYQSPFPSINIKFNTITITCNMTDMDGGVYGSFAPATYPVYNQSKTLMGFNMTNGELQIADRDLFMDLIEQLLLETSATFMLSGVASAKVTTQIGVLVLNNVALSQAITFDGVNGFANDAIKIVPPNNHITAGYEWGFELYLDTTILNPSSVAFTMSRLSFDIFFLGVFIGNGTSANVSMVRGENKVVVQGKYISPNDSALQRQFMSSYLQGNGSEIQLVGNSDNVPLVVNAMAKLNVTVSFIGNTQSLLRWAKLHLPPSGSLALFNPIDTFVYVSSLAEFKIYKTDWTYFTTAYDVTFDPLFVIPPGTTNTTEPMKLKLTIEEFYSVFEGYLFGNHTLLATGVVGVQIENFGPILVDSQQNFTLVGFDV